MLFVINLLQPIVGEFLSFDISNFIDIDSNNIKSVLKSSQAYSRAI